jgi:RNA polymerase sigma factor (sigma-70 family)
MSPLSPPQALNPPPALFRLLNAAEGAELDEAWAEFVATHTGILLHTCRTVVRDRDAAMDSYTYVLEALREDCCRRLRAYAPDPRTRFTTWLVVVARRLVLDFHRRRYGRPRSEDEARRAERATRRRLEDLVAAKLDPDQLTTSSTNSPDAALRHRELADALRSALGELHPSDRLLLALRFEDDRPVREIAGTLGLPTVFHVYRRLGAALDALRGALARRGVEEPEP